MNTVLEAVVEISEEFDSMKELTSLELALVGGGIADPILA